MDLVILRPHTTSLPACRLENSAWLLLITTIVTSFHVCSKFSDFCFSSLICPGHCRKKNRGGMIKNIWHLRWGGGTVSTAGGRRSAKSSVSNKGEWESICFFLLGLNCTVVLCNTPLPCPQAQCGRQRRWVGNCDICELWCRVFGIDSQIDRSSDRPIYLQVGIFILSHDIMIAISSLSLSLSSPNK